MTSRRLPRIRCGMLVGVLSSVIGAPTCWSSGTSEERFDIDIEAQELHPAMNEFQAATHMEVWYGLNAPSDGHIRVNAVHGRLTVTQTLDALFAKKGVTYEIVEKRYVVLDTSRAIPAFAADEVGLTAKTNAADAPSSGADEKRRERPDCPGPGYKWLPSDEGPVGKDCVGIISRRGSEDEGPWPGDDWGVSFVLDREQIEHRQVFTPVELLRQVPVGTGGFTPGVMPGIPGTNPMAIAATRILVDGHELPGVYANGAALPAISGLPTPAVERVELYGETYFGANGGSSGGKTVNFVLARTCDAPRVSVDLGNSFASGSGGHRVYGSFCRVMFQDTELQLKAQVSNQETLRVGDRDFVQSTRSAMLANNPQAFSLTSTPILGDGVNIKFPDGSTTTLSRAEIQAQDAAAAAAHAGTVSTGLVNSAQAAGGKYASLRDGEQSYYLDVAVKQRFSDSLSALFNVVASQASTRTLTSAGDSVDLHNVYVPADAPGNFLRRDLTASIPVEGLDFNLERELAGRQLRFKLKYEPRSRPLSASVDVFASRYAFSWRQPTATGATAAIASGSVDVFNLDALGLMQWVEDYFSPRQLSESWQVRADVAREMVLTSNSTLLLEGRVDRGENDFKGGKELMQGRQDSAPRTVATLSRQTQFVNGEWLGASYFLYPQLSGLYSLHVRVAGRADGYSKVTREPKCLPTCSADTVPDRTEYHAMNPAIDLQYQPSPEWVLKGSFSKGVRIPVSDEIASTAPRVVPAATFRGLQGTGPSDLVLVEVGGKPDVDPEKLRSWSAGFSFAPSFIANLLVSVDYTSVTKDNEIVVPTEFAFSDFPRLAATYADSITSLSPLENPYGAAVGVDLRARNISRAKSRAVEATIQYQRPLLYGFEMRMFTQLHSQLSLKRQASPSSPWEDNTALTAYSPSRFAGVNDLSFRRGRFSFGFLSRYLDGYRVLTSDPEIQLSGDSRLPAQFTQDLYLGYRFAELRSSRIKGDVRLGFTNIGDKSPRRDMTQSNFVSPQDDPRLRSFLLSWTLQF